MYLFILTSPTLLCSSSSHPSLQAGGQFCRRRGGDVDGGGCMESSRDLPVSIVLKQMWEARLRFNGNIKCQCGPFFCYWCMQTLTQQVPDKGTSLVSLAALAALAPVTQVPCPHQRVLVLYWPPSIFIRLMGFNFLWFRILVSTGTT